MSKLCVSCSVVSDSLRFQQALLSMEFSRQGYWSGLPFPSPGDLPDPRIESMTSASPALTGGFFTTEAYRKPRRRAGEELAESHTARCTAET